MKYGRKIWQAASNSSDLMVNIKISAGQIVRIVAYVGPIAYFLAQSN